MGAIPFTRQLGARPGVQLNPIQDNTSYPSLTASDQTVGIVGRFVRGRIDKAFRVSGNNQARNLGPSGSLAASGLNEPRVQIYESLLNGAAEFVVSRLVPAAATINVMVATAAPAAEAPVWVSSATPGAGYLIAVKHLECFGDGVIIEIHADEVLDDEDAPIAASIVKLRLRDPVTNELLFEEFEGSLDPLAKDEFGNSTYLPSVVSAQTDLLEITVALAATVPTSSPFYGSDADGAAKYSSQLLTYFTEGGTTYANGDYDAACTRLKRSQNGFGFIISGGTQNATLLSRLLALGYQTNKQVRWDILGSLSYSAAIAFYKTVGGTDSHYSQCFWAPLLTEDPLNGGKAYVGTAGINAGLACARNARTDSNGVAPKNWPIAGSDYSLNRNGIVQKFELQDEELDDLAKSKINPVIYVNYATGGRYVFNDSLTGALTNGDRKLIAVADMSSTVDDIVAQYALECLQKPMETAVKRMTDFLQDYFTAIETAKWIKPSKELGGRSFMAEIKPNAARPNDRMDVNYWLRYDGTARAIYIQQTLSK